MYTSVVLAARLRPFYFADLHPIVPASLLYLSSSVLRLVLLKNIPSPTICLTKLSDVLAVLCYVFFFFLTNLFYIQEFHKSVKITALSHSWHSSFHVPFFFSLLRSRSRSLHQTPSNRLDLDAHLFTRSYSTAHLITLNKHLAQLQPHSLDSQLSSILFFSFLSSKSFLLLICLVRSYPQSFLTRQLKNPN